MKNSIIFLFVFMYTASAWCAETNPRHYQVTRLMSQAPVIDGILDDEAWNDGGWEGNFIQFEPFGGQEPSQATRFAVMFDDHYLYVAIRAFDSSPDSIVNRLTRRDQADGDAVGIAFDSYFDQRTAFVFAVSSAGIKFDWVITENGNNEDHSWDPNWWVKTHQDDQGWTAEMRIPFSQLRFERNGSSMWGMQVFRKIHRNSEMSFWSHIPRDAPGFVHLFGTLAGLEQIKPRTIFDVTPYAVTSASRYPAVTDNPFKTGRDEQLKMGMDAKIGLSNNLTLDLTISPDFGQVEADPSQVNLTAFETFFQERRPFFIEGRNISNFALGLGDGGGIGNDNLFYSRRIGRRPSGQIQVNGNTLVNTPSFTNIIGAAKLTGKTSSGWSVALIESLTAEANAELFNQGQSSFQPVEPMTNYLISRVQKDFDNGNTMLGGMFTSVHRRLDENLGTQMHSQAYSGGIDFTRYFKDKSWMFNLNAAMSHVAGTPEAMLRTQRSSARYFQRPDNQYASIDSTMTSMTGTGGRMQLGKFGSGHWNFLAAVMWKSPGFEINDMGYMREADQLFQVLYVGYREWRPKNFYRSYNINVNQYNAWTFGGQRIMNGGNVNGFIRLKNYWGVNAGIEYSHGIVSNNILRGGESMRMPDEFNSWYSISTDYRKKLTGSLSGNYGKGMEESSDYYRLGISGTYRPVDYMSVSFSPSYTRRKQELQYVRRTTFQGADRFIFGSLDQAVASFSFRVNLTLMPDLTLQYWGQPFIAVGSYTDFKRITQPKADRYHDRFQVFSPGQISYADGVYRVDENLDGQSDYGFAKPDFRVREFLSNLVLRWEYRPGSSLFLVWNQTRSGYELNGRMNYFHDLGDLFSEKPSNTFLLKFSYRLGLR